MLELPVLSIKLEFLHFILVEFLRSDFTTNKNFFSMIKMYMLMYLSLVYFVFKVGKNKKLQIFAELGNFILHEDSQ